jgi:hypothetical protein
MPTGAANTATLHLQLLCNDGDSRQFIRIMESKQVRCLPVVNTHKGVVGMLALGEVRHAGPEG